MGQKRGRARNIACPHKLDFRAGLCRELRVPCGFFMLSASYLAVRASKNLHCTHGRILLLMMSMKLAHTDLSRHGDVCVFCKLRNMLFQVVPDIISLDIRARSYVTGGIISDKLSGRSNRIRQHGICTKAQLSQNKT